MPCPGLIFEGYALFVLAREFLTSFDFRMLDKDDRVLFIIFQCFFIEVLNPRKLQLITAHFTKEGESQIKRK